MLFRYLKTRRRLDSPTKEKIMPKEKKSNLAIYTLAGSILLSSVIVSMNQVNAHPKDTADIFRLRNCVNNNWNAIYGSMMNESNGYSVSYRGMPC